MALAYLQELPFLLDIYIYVVRQAVGFEEELYL